ncbi:hypothetical protein CC86DRAFT_422328, partial [Ophiobolus disseminans]
LTLTTNLDVLFYQYLYGNELLTYLLLHYHHTVDEIARPDARPFAKLTSVSLCGMVLLPDPNLLVYWVPLPPKVTQLVLRHQYIDHFEFTSERETCSMPPLQFLQGANALTFRHPDPGFTLTLRFLEVHNCDFGLGDLSALLGLGYCNNLEVLRLTKLGPPWHWRNEVDWSVFGTTLNRCLPRLYDFTFSLWWDAGDEHNTEDLEDSVGGLQAHPRVEFLRIDLGLVIHSFHQNAVAELLALPSMAIPRILKLLGLSNANPVFLKRVAQLWLADECRNVLGELMEALSECKFLCITTYYQPTEETLWGLEEIGTSLAEKGESFGVSWVKGGNDDDYEYLVLID